MYASLLVSDLSRPKTISNRSGIILVMVLLRLLSVPFFNVLKFLFCSYLLTCVSSYLANSLERLRRSYCLRHYGKVQIGGPSNSLIRCLGITTSPFTWLLNVTSVILLFSIELAVEAEGTNSVRVGFPRYGKVKLRSIEPFHPSTWSEERGGFKNDFVHCSFQNRTHILIWPTDLIEENGFPRLLCPRNTTTQYLSDNESKATVISIEDLEQEMKPLESAFNADVRGRGELPVTAAFTMPRLVRNHSLSEFTGKATKDRHYLYEYLSPNGIDKLVCVGRRFAFLYEPDNFYEDLLGCIFKAQTKDYYILYHSRTYFRKRKNTVVLAPVAMTPLLNQAMLVEVLQRSYDDGHGSLRRWPRLIGAIIWKMIVEGKLKVRQAKEVKRVVNIEGRIRPVVEIWVLVVVPFFLFLLASLVGFAHGYAIRLFPFREIVGEDNMIRIWAREQRGQLRTDPTEPSWLVLEDDGDGKRLRAFIDEPGSRLLQRRTPIRGLM